ncbi:MAG TPA: chemotaxis protein CheW [Chthoniobacterales bacterium]|nr:chemotaxis protein CheW [Chthoniobacterales bacterium]
MLHLLVRLGNDAYAIGTSDVRRIVPLARLKALPSDIAAIAGVLNFHGQAVPVLDLTRLLTGASSREILGTRIVVADVELRGTGPRLLGLVVEGAHSVARLDLSQFQPAGIRPDGREWLGPVIEYEDMLVQRIEIASLLPADVVDALVRDSETALFA